MILMIKLLKHMVFMHNFLWLKVLFPSFFILLTCTKSIFINFTTFLHLKPTFIPQIAANNAQIHFFGSTINCLPSISTQNPNVDCKKLLKMY